MGWTPDTEVVYFPPNTMSLDPLLDQGAMRTCNAYHTQYFMEKIVNSLEENPHRKNIMKVWKSYSTEDVITVNRKKKKKKIKPQTVNSYWRKSCLNAVCAWLQGRRQWQPTPVSLPGKSHGQRSLIGCSPWGHEESDTTEQLHFHFSLSCIGEGNGNPLQCSCLEDPRDFGAWWAAVYGVAQSRTQLKRLSSSSMASGDLQQRQ